MASTIFSNVNVIDGSGSPGFTAQVKVQGNRIQQIARDGASLERGDAQLVCEACEGPVDINGLCIPADQGIVGRAVKDNACQIVRDVRLDPDFEHTVDADTGFTTRSILCAPMSVKDRCVGTIEIDIVDVQTDAGFETRDRVLLANAANEGGQC